MKTLYIDVYFLINFTVDMLSVYFSVRLLNIRCRMLRVALVSLIGAASAIVDIFISEYLPLRIISALTFLVACSIVVARNISIGRRIKFLLLFFVAQTLLGGTVYFAYDLFDRVLGKYLEGVKGGSENRGALILSVIILLSIGVFKLLIMLFSSSADKRNIRIRISACGQSAEVDALIDSGNLVTDPMNMSPVLFVKPSFAKQIFPENIIELKDIDSLDRDYRKRIRLIPVTRGGETHVMTGIRVDSVEVLTERGLDAVDVTVAIDREGGTFGGFDALAPSAVIRNVY